MASVTRPPFTYPEVPLHELLRASRRRFPEKAAVIFEDRVITYTELEARVNRLARALLACGVRRGAGFAQALVHGAGGGGRHSGLLRARRPQGFRRGVLAKIRLLQNPQP